MGITLAQVLQFFRWRLLVTRTIAERSLGQHRQSVAALSQKSKPRLLRLCPCFTINYSNKESANMTIKLKQSTASQEIPLGYFVDATDGNTEKTALTIANTDIKLWKMGASSLV